MTEQTLRHDSLSPNTTPPSQAPSRFTALNVLNPPEERSVIRDDGNQTGDTEIRARTNEGYTAASGFSPLGTNSRTTPPIHRTGSQSSAGVKRSSSPERTLASPESLQSRKKRRISLPPGAPESLISVGNGDHRDQDQVYVEAPLDTRQSVYTELPGWQHDQRGGSINSDTQLAEALHRDSQRFVASQSGSAEASPVQGYRVHSPHRTSHHSMGSNISSATAAMLQKQRKRNFSNRTKTGCLTCRERKKKCDEAKPTCHNCERGGFHCKGYTLANGVFKPSVPREQPPLQAKTEYYAPASSSPYPPPRPVPGSQYPGLPLPDFRPAESGRPRPMSMEQERDAARFLSNQQEQGVASPYARQEWPAHQQNQPGPDILHRQGPEPLLPSMMDLPHLNTNIARPGPPVPLHPPHEFNTNQSLNYTDQRMTAQLALEHPSSRISCCLPAPVQDVKILSEKAKMSSGVPFNISDPILKQARRDCAAAVYRFNKNAAEPGGLSDRARWELFRSIIEPHLFFSVDGADGRVDTSPTSTASVKSSNGNGSHDHHSSPTAFGHLGTNVEVEAPFHCDYGWNIRIGDGVTIGRNCHIMDSAMVSIGARTIIKADVKIVTEESETLDPMMQPAGGRSVRCRKVVIGCDCYIGPGVVIQPGTTLENGAVVMAPQGVVVSIGGQRTGLS